MCAPQSPSILNLRQTIERVNLTTLKMNTSITTANPIICGTDFSESAAQAAAVADALARHLQAPLFLVCSADERGDFPENIRTRLMNEDRPRLAQEAERLRSLGLTFNEELIGGVPDHGVRDFAVRKGAQLVIVGASGTGSMRGSRWLLGNVAERIAETSSVPTLVVRAAEPLVAWARGERPLQVFIAVDFTSTAEAALRWLAQWQQIGLCRITLGYIHQIPEVRGELGGVNGLGSAKLVPYLRKSLEEDLREKAHQWGVKATIRVEPRTARVDSHLISLATQAGAELLVLGAHQWQNLERVWHASISRRILHDAPMNVACVPVSPLAQGTAALIPTFRRVLVATDFSECAGHAVPYAYSALARQGAVCLVHVAQPGVTHEKSEVEARLRKLIPAEADARGVVTDVRILENGDVGLAICETAERFGADLVCIGSHGYSGLAAAVMGSVAQAVISRSSRPVLLVQSPSP
ncbi:MAG: Universal stress protein [Chthoniobacteraceae bacterium]|nr:Universal stress protein [Chthoniobacteraceae bacterium]